MWFKTWEFPLRRQRKKHFHFIMMFFTLPLPLHFYLQPSAVFFVSLPLPILPRVFSSFFSSPFFHPPPLPPFLPFLFDYGFLRDSPALTGTDTCQRRTRSRSADDATSPDSSADVNADENSPRFDNRINRRLKRSTEQRLVTFSALLYVSMTRCCHEVRY